MDTDHGKVAVFSVGAPLCLSATMLQSSILQALDLIITREVMTVYKSSSRWSL